MPYNSRADVVHLLADWYDTKLGGFRSQLQASCVSSHTEKSRSNETVNLGMTIYIYIYIYIQQRENDIFKNQKLKKKTDIKEI